MKFIALLFLFIINYASISCNLIDCIEMCKIGAVDDLQKWTCIRECHEEATFGGYKLKSVQACLNHCDRKAPRQFREDCKASCNVLFTTYSDDWEAEGSSSKSKKNKNKHG